MRVVPAGTRVDYTVTWLELDRRPSCKAGPAPDRGVSLALAERPPAWYFFSLYDAVGRDYAWDDMHELGSGEVEEILSHPETRLYSMLRSGWPQGFFVLDARNRPACDILYFGLVEQAIGKGLGSWLLDAAVSKGWDCPGVRKITVNTCSLDHPRALGMYIGKGFAPVREEHRSRVLMRDLPVPPEERTR